MLIRHRLDDSLAPRSIDEPNIETFPRRTSQDVEHVSCSRILKRQGPGRLSRFEQDDIHSLGIPPATGVEAFLIIYVGRPLTEE